MATNSGSPAFRHFIFIVSFFSIKIGWPAMMVNVTPPLNLAKILALPFNYEYYTCSLILSVKSRKSLWQRLSRREAKYARI
jgi:hypothetical protein